MLYMPWVQFFLVHFTCNFFWSLEKLIRMYVAILWLEHPIKPKTHQQKINFLHPADYLDLNMTLT